jgi:hypothetical protein
VLAEEKLVQRLVRTRPLAGRRVIGREQIIHRLDHLAIPHTQTLIRRLKAELVPAISVTPLIVEIETSEMEPQLRTRSRDSERRRPRRIGRRKMRRALITGNLAVGRSIRPRRRLDLCRIRCRRARRRRDRDTNKRNQGKTEQQAQLAKPHFCPPLLLRR